MELTWVALSSVLLLGVGYAFVQRAQRSALVCWLLLGGALFALATRDLLRSREQNRPGSTGRVSPGNRTDRADDDRERKRPPLVDRILRRVTGWLT